MEPLLQVRRADKIFLTNPTAHESFRPHRRGVPCLLDLRPREPVLFRRNLLEEPGITLLFSSRRRCADSHGLRRRRRYPQHPSSLGVLCCYFPPIRSLILGNGASITNLDSILVVLRAALWAFGPAAEILASVRRRKKLFVAERSRGTDMFASIRQRRNIPASQAKINDSKCFSQDSEKQIFSSHF